MESKVSGSTRRSVNFLRLMMTLVFLHVVQPFLEVSGRAGAFVVALVFIGTLVTASLTIATTVHERRFYYALAPAVTALHAAFFLFPSDLTLQVLTLSGYLMFFTLVCVRVLRHVFEEGQVDGNRLYAVCCVYLLAALAWGFFYAILESLQAGSFTGSNLRTDGTELVASMMYFSLVTLTTLGYGDISPVSSFARTFATLQAAFGQIYLTVLVARLLGFHVSSSGRIPGARGSEGDG